MRLHLDRYDRILATINERGIALEINTRSGDRLPAEVRQLLDDHDDIVLTVGSDAHERRLIGRRVMETHAVLAARGYDTCPKTGAGRLCRHQTCREPGPDSAPPAGT